MTFFHSISTARRLSLVLLLFSAAFVAGCDSNDDDDTVDGDDSDRLVGVWEATSIMAGPLDILSIAEVSMTVVFESNGDASVTVTQEDGSEVGVTGTYSVNQSAGTIVLDGDDVEEDLVLDYSFVDDNNLEASFPGSSLGNLGIDLGAAGDLIEGLTVNVDLTKSAA